MPQPRRKGFPSQLNMPAGAPDPAPRRGEAASARPGGYFRAQARDCPCEPLPRRPQAPVEMAQDALRPLPEETALEPRMDEVAHGEDLAVSRSKPADREELVAADREEPFGKPKPEDLGGNESQGGGAEAALADEIEGIDLDEFENAERYEKEGKRRIGGKPNNLPFNIPDGCTGGRMPAQQEERRPGTRRRRSRR